MTWLVNEVQSDYQPSRRREWFPADDERTLTRDSMMNKLSQISILNRIGRSLIVVVLAGLLAQALGASAVKEVEARPAIEGMSGATAEAYPAEVALASLPIPAIELPVTEQVNLLLDDDHDDAVAHSASKQPRVLWMEVTAYCACKKCCGPKAQGLTASGKRVTHNHGRFVAADTDVLPFGTQLKIPGYHNARPVEVIDRGGAIKGHKLDVFFPSHKVAKEWGRRWVPVTVVE